MKMKNSNKILLGAGLIPVLIIILMFLALKIMPNNAFKNMSSQSGAKASRTIDLRDFSKLSIKGVWAIHLIQGSDYKVEIKALEESIDKIKVEKRDSILFIDDNPNSLKSNDNKNQEATIILPVLDEIDLNGVNNLNLSGIKCEDFSIHTEGATRISNSDGSIQNLSIGGNGVSTINLSGISVTNAIIEYQGVYYINLLMNGGRLSGRLDGLGSFNYQGDVSVNEIKVNNNSNKVTHQSR
jgi:hypothetical protein